MSFKQLLENDKDIRYINDYIISKISNKNSYISIDFYENHIIICAKISYELAKERHVDEKTAVIAALLHDFAMYNTKVDHEIIGSKYAEEILKELNYNKKDIVIISHAIKNHRTGKLKSKNKYDLIISDADAISYIKKFSFFEEYERSIHKEQADAILVNKLEKIYDIITSDGFKIIEKDYHKIKNRLENNMKRAEAKDFLGKIINIKIDRQLGTKHPKHGFVYMVNYGFVPDTISGDGEELDAYLLGVFDPVEEYAEGEVIAYIHRTNDDDDKLIVVPKGVNYTDEQIRALTEFQERFFESIIIR